MTQKITICPPSHNFVGLYLRNQSTCRQLEKNLLNSDTSSTCRHNITPEICSGVLEQPSKFQGVSRIGRVTARHSISGRQPNFAALSRGRQLHSEGRPSRWASAHILVKSYLRNVNNGVCDTIDGIAVNKHPKKNERCIFTQICAVQLTRAVVSTE